MLSKIELRKKMIELRENLDNHSFEEYNRSILKKVIECDEFKKANNIFIFVSFNKEVDTHGIIEHCIDLGKKVSVPKVISKDLGMKAISIEGINELKPSKYGILEPEYEEDKIMTEESIDLVILPGLAFDSSGGRIGYGAGYYDRFLKKLNHNCKKVGICFDFQMVKKVPMDENDEYIDFVITN